MAGINLSQSIQEKQSIARGSFFDKGFFINLSILILVAGLYGGSHWYLGALEEELTTLQGDSAQRTVGLKSEDADSAVDFRARLDTVAANLKSNADPNDAFKELEESTIQMIRITEYTRNQTDNTITIHGVTSNLKYLAQQMFSYKKMVGATSVHVESVKYNDLGQVEFEILIPLSTGSPEKSSV